jgi:hypothetical protein
MINALQYLQNVALSPKGERVLFGGRGDVFSAPVEKRRDAQSDAFVNGRTINFRAGRRRLARRIYF